MSAKQLGFEQSKVLLETYGIPILGRVAQNLADTKSAAAELGYPVVLKGVSEKIIHKTDVGVVFLDIQEESELVETFSRIQENARNAGAEDEIEILVQKMAAAGFELLIGARQDACFGPVTMIGHGGRFVELFADVCPGVGELNRADVLRMLAQTMAGKIIDGFRGPALDKESVIKLTIDVSRLMLEHPEVNELDLNPVMVYEDGFAIVDARVIEDKPISFPRAEDLSEKRMKSLDAIFHPESAAVIGASRPGTIGGILLKNSSKIKKLYPINPKYAELLGRKSYPTLASLPEAPEVAVLAVSPDQVISSFREFCEMGGKGAIIVTDGFAEVGRWDLEDQLLEISRKHDVVYIGPNGLGVIDNFSGLNTLFIPKQRSVNLSEPNGLGIISQSGGIGLEFLEMLKGDNLSVGRWVSCGNASGVTIAEILAHMGDDPKIKIIAVYLEGLVNGLQFVEIAGKVSQKKPVVVIKGGVSGGAKATMSHTASLAGSFQAFKACCDKAGLYLLKELTEDPKVLINILSLLTTQPRAHGNRVAVLSVGGGAAILLADQIANEGMELATFAPDTVKQLQELLGGKMKGQTPDETEKIVARLGVNPVDLFGDCNDERVLQALRILDKDPNTDILLTALYFQVPYLSEYFTERLVELNKELDKPFIVSPRGFSEYVFRSCQYLAQNYFPVYTVPLVKPLAIATKIWRRYETDFTESRG